MTQTHTNDYHGGMAGIDIFGIFAVGHGMSDVFAALDAAGINYNTAESSDHQVFVDHNHVGRAVAAINALGYETDEDEDEDEE